MRSNTIFNKCDERINNRLRLIIGLVLIAAAVAIDVISGYKEAYNGFVAIVFATGLLSIVNIAFTNLYKNRQPYVLYMLFNIIGMLLYLYVISQYNIIGGLYTFLFSVLVFIAMWITDMLVFVADSPAKRILGGLLVNAIVMIIMVMSVFAVAAISVIFLYGK